MKVSGITTKLAFLLLLQFLGSLGEDGGIAPFAQLSRQIAGFLCV